MTIIKERLNKFRKLCTKHKMSGNYTLNTWIWFLYQHGFLDSFSTNGD